MANGFLSKDGIWTECGYMQHFDCARRILSSLCCPANEYNYPYSPPDVLCEKYGYIHFHEHYNGMCGGVREPEYDGAFFDKKYKLSQQQYEWLNKHLTELSLRQQELLNGMINR